MRAETTKKKRYSNSRYFRAAGKNYVGTCNTKYKNFEWKNTYC